MKFKQAASVDKVMALVFWDSEGIIVIDYLEKRKIITGLFCASKVKEDIKQKCQRKLRTSFFFFQDNVPIHNAPVALAKTVNLGFELRLHLPYSLDLTLFDLFPFPKLKSHLCGFHIGKNVEAMWVVEELRCYLLLWWDCNAWALLDHMPWCQKGLH